MSTRDLDRSHTWRMYAGEFVCLDCDVKAGKKASYLPCFASMEPDYGSLAPDA